MQGVFNPKKYKNTCLIFKKGWSRVIVDIDPIKITAFDFVRNKVHNVAYTIGSVRGEIEYYTKGFYSLTISTRKNFSSNPHDYIKKETIGKRLDDVLESSPI